MVTKEEVVDALKTVFDPELMMDLWSLELIYDVQVNGPDVKIKMTFTTPACPYGPQLVNDVKATVGKLPGVIDVQVDVVFSPPWNPSQELRAALGVL